MLVRVIVSFFCFRQTPNQPLGIVQHSVCSPFWVLCKAKGCSACLSCAGVSASHHGYISLVIVLEKAAAAQEGLHESDSPALRGR